MIKISVIIPTYDRKNELNRCLASLSKQTYPKEQFEIIVIDDASNGHKGPAHARNLGIKKAKGEIIAFIDDDAVCQEDWLEKALPHFSDKNIAGVEGRIEFENLKGGLYRTCNIFYRKEILEEIDGFDERFSMAFREDSDLAFRILKKGYRIIFAPEVSVSHFPDPLTLKRSFQLAKRYYFDSLLCRKHPQFYRERIERFNLGPIKIYRPKQRLYQVYVLSFVLVLLFSLLGLKRAIVLISPLFLFSYLGIFLGANRFRQIKKMSLKDLFISIPVYFVVPFVYFYYLVRGMIDFRQPRPHGRN